MTGRGGDRSTPPADMFTPATSIDGMEGLGDAGGTELIPSRTELIPSTSSSVSSSSAVVVGIVHLVALIRGVVPGGFPLPPGR